MSTHFDMKLWNLISREHELNVNQHKLGLCSDVGLRVQTAYS